MVKKISLLLIVVATAGIGVIVFAQAEPPATVCGDGVVQAPNSNGQNEKCDDGGDSELCTAQCGQKLLGWAWSSNFGWLSLNDANCEYFLEPSQPPLNCPGNIEYYVQVDSDDELKGYAWSNNIGWLCFGESCTGTTPSGDPSTAFVVNPGSEPGQEAPVFGWVKAIGSSVLSTFNDQLWFSLNCDNEGVANCGGSNYEVRLGNDFFYQANNTTAINHPTLIGYAWNDVDTGGGLGWLQFNPEESFAWLQTRLGDIYAGGEIRSRRPQGVFNATYRILANNDVTIEFASASGLFGTDWIDPTYGPIDFPTPQSRYSNVLGKVDLTRLTCTFANQNQPSCVNQYGQTVTKITTVADLNDPLGGDIYYYPGIWNIAQNRYDPDTFSVDSPTTLSNADNFENGSGLIIINGNLNINENITYEDTGTLGKFRNLASVAWLVKGDTVVAPSVTDAAGAFVTLGNGSNCPAIGQPSNGCGRFSTGSLPPDNFLTISGLVMARQFNFQRTASSPLRGSELIIYDGRLLANIPPGLSDFAAALPIWRSATFSP